MCSKYKNIAVQKKIALVYASKKLLNPFISQMIMFGKKSCKRCGKKIDKDFEYCPHCGTSVVDGESDERDYGFLGKDDMNFNDIKMPLGFNTVFKKLMKEMDKQFRELDKEIGKEKGMNKLNKNNPNMKQGGISINISSGAGKPVIKVKSFGNMPEFRVMENQIKQPNKQAKQTKQPVRKVPQISEEQAKKLAKLPREEASSKVRRLSGKVVYEIDLPDVKEGKDIIINKLENSIEVKAFAKDKAYFKFLPVSLPLVKSRFADGKLILELGEK
jgi:hypothetical protein